MIGVASRNEKRAASSWLSPRASPATIVAPERLMPAKKARIWAEPISTALPPGRLPGRAGPAGGGGASGGARAASWGGGGRPPRRRPPAGGAPAAAAVPGPPRRRPVGPAPEPLTGQQ